MKNIHITMARQLSLLAALLTSLFTFAQSPSGTVKGTVRSPSGTPLSRVSVQAANSGKGASTDENGTYTLTLPAGNYEISYSAPGHTTQTVSVTITPGATIVQDIILAPQFASIGNPNPTAVVPFEQDDGIYRYIFAAPFYRNSMRPGTD